MSAVRAAERAAVLVEALPYIQRFAGQVVVVKYGGNALAGASDDDALALYDRAAGLGLKDADFVQAHEQARGRVARLEGMLKMVREMERPAGIQGLGEAKAEAPAVPAVK